MEYIDSFEKDSLTNVFIDKDILKLSSDFISLALELVDALRDTVKRNEETLENLFTSDPHNPRIQKLTTKNDLYKTNLHLLLLECDIFTAFKYLAGTKNDWDYRFFVRRIYTLLHETYQVVSRLNKLSKDISIYYPGNPSQEYNKSIKAINKYLNDNDATFKEIRNKCEAHKDSDTNLQIRLIEQISIERSASLIESAIKNYNMISKSIGEILKYDNQIILNSLQANIS